jgi:NADH-quinone oxidoreductase subunit E
MVLSVGKTQIGKENFTDRNKHSLIALLQEIQEQYSYLPEDLLRELAGAKKLALIDIYSVATFYKSFSLKPRGRRKIVTCTGTACHVRGSEKVSQELSRILGISSGATTEDGEYSLENVNCLGACALAPLIVVDGEYLGHMSAAKVAALFKERLKHKKEESVDHYTGAAREVAKVGCACAAMLK